MKTWFITGSSRGFGREWTIAALERGDRVVATARNPDTLRDIRGRFPDTVLVLPLDVTDRQAVFSALFARASNTSGGSTLWSTTPTTANSA